MCSCLASGPSGARKACDDESVARTAPAADRILLDGWTYWRSGNRKLLSPARLARRRSDARWKQFRCSSGATALSDLGLFFGAVQSPISSSERTSVPLGTQPACAAGRRRASRRRTARGSRSADGRRTAVRRMAEALQCRSKGNPAVRAVRTPCVRLGPPSPTSMRLPATPAYRPGGFSRRRSRIGIMVTAPVWHLSPRVAARQRGRSGRDLAR